MTPTQRIADLKERIALCEAFKYTTSTKHLRKQLNELLRNSKNKKQPAGPTAAASKPKDPSSDI